MTTVDFAEAIPDTIASLRDAILRAGFDDAWLARAEAIAPRRLDPIRLPVVHAWLRSQSDHAAILGRLFAYADAVSREEADAALGPDLREALRRAGMLHAEGDEVRAAIRLVPLCGQMLASDPMETAGDPVMGPGAFTLEMARLMPVAEGDRVLDVGSGAGSLTLVAAARGAARVTGVDLHPRAAAVARFNAILGGHAAIAEFLTGDLTAPVTGRRFDLVVAQPPFVVKPPDVQATTYLHGGPQGDELALRLCAELPGVLAEGGRALVLVETLRSAEAIGRAVGEALGGAPVTAIALVSPGTSADMLAIGYAAIAHPGLGPDYARTAQRYYAHLREHGPQGTRHVLVDVRARAGQSRGVAVTVERSSLSGFDPAALVQLERAIDLAVADDATLIEGTVAVAPGGVIVQTQSLDDGRSQLRLRWSDGARDEQVLTDAAGVVVDVARAPTRVHTIVAAYAEAAGSTPAAVRDDVLTFVRRSLAAGLLVVADPPQ